MGSFNFSSPADVKNGENLLLIKDRRIAVAYTVEALRIFDHYQFRVVEQTAKKAKTKLELRSRREPRARPPGGRRTTPTPERSEIGSCSREPEGLSD